MNTLAAAAIENDSMFMGLAWSFAISGLLLLVVAFIGGKNTIGRRVFFGILGLVLVGVAMLCISGVWNEIWIGGGKSTLCILFGPWAALIWGVVGIFKEFGGGDKRDVPAPTAQQWNQQPGVQQWGAPGQPGQPQQWGQQPPPQQQVPQQWGQPPAQPQPPQQGWGQPEHGYQQPGQPPQGQQPPQQGWQQYPPQA